MHVYLLLMIEFYTVCHIHLHKQNASELHLHIEQWHVADTNYVHGYLLNVYDFEVCIL
jgi:hypothetical protein